MILLCMTLCAVAVAHAQSHLKMNEVHKNSIIVRWEIMEEHIHFEMEAPTDGWVAIGLNEEPSLAGTYLLMGRIRNGKAEVVEHYTEKPGSYKPLAAYGLTPTPFDVSGGENTRKTRLSFSVPIQKVSKYHKQLLTGTEWTLLMAYSLSDDFQHHSIMRTSMKIKL